MRKGMIPLCLVLLLLVAGCGSGKINASDYVELGPYKGLTVTRMATTVSEEDLQKQVDRMLSAYADAEPVTDRKDVQEGDIANIDYEGKIDGVAFDGGSAKGFDLEIGSGTFIPGFEDGLIGARVGQTVDVTVRFPDEYTNNPNLAGKPAVFTVTVNSISKKVLPELTEDFLREKTGGQFASTEEIKDYLREQTAGSLLEYANSTMRTQLLSQAVENATLKQDIPQEYLEEKQQGMIRTAKSNAEAYGNTFEDYLQNYLRMDEASFMETVQQSAPSIAKQSLTVQAIADAEGIQVTEDEFKQRVAMIMSQYGYQKEKDLYKTVTKEDITETMLLEKVEQFLVDHAVVTEQEQ